MSKFYIGVDPGASGAYCALTPCGVVQTLKASETLADHRDWFEQFHDCDTRALLERVSAMPTQGVSSTFKFGTSYGHCEMILTCAKIPFERITPAKWQGAMKCRTGGDKNVSKRRAQELFPKVKITHATADAILLAELCRRQHEDF